MESEKECSLQRAELRRHLAAGHIPESWTQLPLRHLSLIGGLSGSLPASLARLSATLEHLEVTQPPHYYFFCSIGPQNLTGVWLCGCGGPSRMRCPCVQVGATSGQRAGVVKVGVACPSGEWSSPPRLPWLASRRPSATGLVRLPKATSHAAAGQPAERPAAPAAAAKHRGAAAPLQQL